MKGIPKKELEKLYLINYDASIYKTYFTDKKQLAKQIAKYNFNVIVDMIDDLVESYFIVYFQRWTDRCVCKSFRLLSEKRQLFSDKLQITFTCNSRYITVKDKNNTYYILKPEWFLKDELKASIMEWCKDDKEKANADSIKCFNKPFDRLTKQDLIDLLYDEYLERC